MFNSSRDKFVKLWQGKQMKMEIIVL